MSIFNVITLGGGLSFFLYGMIVLSGSLERMAGGRLETALRRLTSNRFKCLALGAGITAAVQSSSAVTVMLVGLVNSGIMSLGQSIGVIMGSNIGTTMTAWILTMVGIESNNVFVSLLKPENFSLVFSAVGIVMIMASKSDRKKDIGTVLVGFAVLMYGMKLMSSAVKPLAELPSFKEVFLAFKNPILGVLVGLIITAIIQSSSASVGILQALALTGVVSYGAAIPIIMGQNIGTCVTAIISSIGVNNSAKKVAVVHLTFNLIGTAVCLAAYCLVAGLIQPAIINEPIDAFGIAVVHTSFNVITTAMLIPFTTQLETLANKILPDSKENRKELLDRRLINTPSVAIAECDNLTMKMSEIANSALLSALSLLEGYDEKTANQVIEDENTLDYYEDELGTYLVQLSSKSLSGEDSLKISKMLHSIGDFERLGDHAINIVEAVKELHDKNISFSQSATNELSVLLNAIKEILKITNNAYRYNDLDCAIQVEPLEETVDRLTEQIKSRHIARLQKGECSIELGFVLSDLITNLERVSDHCSNIAVAVIELSHNSFDTHKYINNLRAGSESYKESFKRFSERYVIG